MHAQPPTAILTATPFPHPPSFRSNPGSSPAPPLRTRGLNRPRIGHIRECEDGMDPDLNIIDRFMGAFGNYIDSGFGLLSGDVAFLTTVLIGIDVTLAALWWAMDNDQDVLGKLIKKEIGRASCRERVCQ